MDIKSLAPRKDNLFGLGKTECPDKSGAKNFRKGEWGVSKKLLSNAVTQLSIMLALLAPAAQAALYTYTYTGSNFTTHVTPYLPTDHVQLQFTIDLPSNINLAQQDRAAAVRSFLIYDGQKSTTNANVEFLAIEFSTDSTGAIIDWVFFTGRPAGVISTIKGPFAQDVATLIFPGPVTPVAIVDDRPGVWAVAQISLPGSTALFVAGMCALAGVRKTHPLQDDRA